MSTTGIKSPTTAANGIATGEAWDGLANIAAVDGTYVHAVCSKFSETKDLEITGFFALGDVPTGATVDEITLTVHKRQQEVTGVGIPYVLDKKCRISLNGGSTILTDKSTSDQWPQGPIGSTDYSWGAVDGVNALNPDWFDSNLKVIIAAQQPYTSAYLNVDVDSATLEVLYTVSGGGGVQSRTRRRIQLLVP